MESEALKTAFLKLANMSISASWLVLAIFFLRLVLKKAPKWVSVLLWGIVAARLICPFSIESALSLIPSTQTIPMNIEMAAKP
ncbi:MAG: transcriptional regulator, partial [Oscillospiraceae bacterium]|nr:transcriptional regulator [Oscillospiraceae bacterium]